jgi:hypothetical protein
MVIITPSNIRDYLICPFLFQQKYIVRSAVFQEKHSCQYNPLMHRFLEEYPDSFTQVIGVGITYTNRIEVSSGSFVTLRCTIDLLRRPSAHSLEAISFGSNKPRTELSRRTPLTDIGNFILHYLVHCNNQECGQISLRYINLFTLEENVLTYSEEKSQSMTAQLLSILRLIGEKRFPPQTSWFCAICVIKDSCPAFEGERIKEFPLGGGQGYVTV